MKFIFWSEPTFEPWDWTNPETVGIGGSETSHIEMSNRLADRGHEVVSFAPVPIDAYDLKNPHGVMWYSSANELTRKNMSSWNTFPATEAIWIIYRAPHIVDNLPEGQRAWLVCQDVDYRELTPERAQRFEFIIALCSRHAEYLRGKLNQADKVIVSSNGIRTESIREALKNPPPRNPKRLMYASSPDRGLRNLIPIFQLAREIVPDLELHVYYGFNNIEKVIAKAGDNTWVKDRTQEIIDLLETPGVVNHGRMGQTALYREWAQSGLWVHPSNFTETSCITCMDAQALGAIPITIPTWAVGENVKYGQFIDGNIDKGEDHCARARFVLAVTQWARQPEKQEAVRAEMMEWAQEWFDWDTAVMQWEELALAPIWNVRIDWLTWWRTHSRRAPLRAKCTALKNEVTA